MAEIKITEKVRSKQKQKPKSPLTQVKKNNAHNQRARRLEVVEQVSSPKNVSRENVTIHTTSSGRVISEPSSEMKMPNFLNGSSFQQKARKSKYTTAVMLPYMADKQGVPDPIAEMTGIIQVPINGNLPVIGAGQANPVDYSYNGANNFNGALIVKGARTFFNPIAYMAESPITVAPNANSVPYSQTILVKAQSANAGIFDISGRPVVGDGQPMFLPGSGLPVNLVGPVNIESGVSMDFPIFPFVNSNPIGNFYGYSISFRSSDVVASNGQIIITLVCDVPSGTISGGLIVNMVDTTGVIATQTVNLVNGATIATFASTALPSSGYYNGDHMVGFTVQAAAGSGADITIDNFNVTFQWFAGHTYPQLTWKPLNFDDVSGASKAYSKYRVVGMSMWLKYIGGYGISDTGGTISSASYAGGNSVTYGGNSLGSFLWTDTGLRSLDKTYVGELEKGSYGFLPPSDFRSLSFYNYGSHEPYSDTQGIMIAKANMNATTKTYPLNILMLKGCVMYEATPQRSWVDSRASPVNRSELEATKKNVEKVMRSHGTFMANSTHEDIIEYGKIPGIVISENFKSLMPVVQSILPFIMGAAFL